MDYIELLTVEDCFQITDKGIVVMPNFPVPRDWKNRKAEVVIQATTGQEFKTTAQLDRVHFRIANPTVPAEHRWRVTITFQDLSKRQLPPGTQILAPIELCELLRSSVSDNSLK